MQKEKGSSLSPFNPETILAAHQRIKPYIHRTPVLQSRQLRELSGAEVFIKCENLQKVGAFKMRGAANAVFSLKESERQKGVATHSSGNHAQALALAARLAGVPAYIVMPKTAPKVKVAAVKDYGAEIIFCEPTLQARESTLEAVVARTGATFIHPYNNDQVIAGQATAARELFEQVEGPLDVVLTPVGGGGLLSGTVLAARCFSPATKVWAGEPAGADDAYQSLKAGHLIPHPPAGEAGSAPNTIADGLLTSLGDKTWAIISQGVEQIIPVTEEEIISAMRFLWERMKLVVEPSGAVPLAAMLKEKGVLKGKRVGIILSGGNVDLSKLPF
ncbi:pyridoxal-phosphate dependent enzyme [Cesiribacter andamanensis]|uniref:L-threonine dehydratase catabolic TdcB n=1 Tax=Cesiribacter andamanensis AMV16 TaxID=1279009 RepID=M7NPJ0_9BACT|nr:pyridoxal-phosphate dependent enzyme [Cesiribacter andamanensis]EMR03635.1 L-threonine dehydratase catabolic TdcB [Cesiribacter andamanensis AMV16]